MTRESSLDVSTLSAVPVAAGTNIAVDTQVLCALNDSSTSAPSSPILKSEAKPCLPAASSRFE